MSADKGGGIVIQDKVDYNSEAERLLSDTHTYVKLIKEPLPPFKIEAYALVLGDEVFSKAEASFFFKRLLPNPILLQLAESTQE